MMVFFNIGSKSALAMLCCCLNIKVLAQEALTIHLDAQTGKCTYSKAGEVIRNPSIKRGQAVVIEIQNYNNYLYALNITEQHQDIEPSQGDNPLNKMNSFGFRDLFQSVTSSQPPASHQFKAQTELVPVRPLVHTAVWSDRSAIPGGQAQMYQAALKQLQDLSEIEYQLEEYGGAVKAFEQRKIMRTVAVTEVEKMRLNPHLPPTRLRQHCLDLLAEALNLSKGHEPGLHEVLERNDDQKLLATLTQQVSQLKRKYQFGTNNLQLLDAQFEVDSAQPVGLLHQAIETQLQRANSFYSQEAALQQHIDSLSSTTPSTGLDALLPIWYLYEAINSNTFSSVYRTTAQHDVLVFQPQFTRRAEVTNAEVPEHISFAPIVVRTHGGIKVNTSVGLTLGQYQQAQYSWFVRDSIISAQEEDRFTPFVASYLHFYSQGRKNISVGGSLGLGLPIGSELGLSNAHLFVGPSLFFGEAERFVLNIGLMAGKTRQLAKGLKTGDILEAEVDELPHYERYQFGYMAGLSFNLR